jgi:hypothetical protein
MRKLLFTISLILTSCYVETAPDPEPECHLNSDCSNDEMCQSGYCIYNPPVTPKKQCGELTLQCGCWTPPPGSFPGQVRQTDLCQSGYDQIFLAKESI